MNPISGELKYHNTLMERTETSFALSEVEGSDSSRRVDGRVAGEDGFVKP